MKRGLVIHLIKRAAEQGYADAQYELGSMYYGGDYSNDGVTRNYPQALYWFQKAAEQGMVSARHKLGHMYYNGEGVRENIEKAADFGHNPALYELGHMYYFGTGVKKDIKKTEKLMSIAANTGYHKAIRFLRNNFD